MVRKNAIKNTGLSEEQTSKIITPLEGIYLIIDHVRTLIFAISDGALPSNVGGGYNLRIMLRRVISTMNRLSLQFDMNDIIDTQINYLKNTYPELENTRNDVKEIIRIESERYDNSKQRMEKIARNLNNDPTVDDLIRLYESDGVTPDYLKEMNVIQEIPSTFYSKLSELHQGKNQKEQKDLPLQDLPETELLFYSNDPKEFDAKVLKSFDNYVVLDKTSFYARGGGQEPDHGKINDYEVVDVTKHGDIIVHELKGGAPKQGDTVSCIINSTRRDRITKNHTSTHVLNTSARSVLGSWVWQHSAFKEEDHARLDITHHSALTEDEVSQIEQTSEIKQVKITKSKRIQDGVVRIEFVSGDMAKEFALKKQQDTKNMEETQKMQEKKKEKRLEKKQITGEKIPKILSTFSQSEQKITVVDNITMERAGSNKPDFCYSVSDDYDDDFHIKLGESLCKNEQNLVYCGIFDESEKVRVIVYCSEQASKNKKAGDIVKSISEILGGAGGGNSKFAQGGGNDKSKKEDAIKKAKSIVLE